MSFFFRPIQILPRVLLSQTSTGVGADCHPACLPKPLSRLPSKAAPSRHHCSASSPNRRRHPQAATIDRGLQRHRHQGLPGQVIVRPRPRLRLVRARKPRRREDRRFKPRHRAHQLRISRPLLHRMRARMEDSSQEKTTRSTMGEARCTVRNRTQVSMARCS